MKSTAALFIAMSLALGGSAFAAERAAKNADCQTLSSFQSKAAKVMAAMSDLAKATGAAKTPEIAPFDTFTKLSQSRFHFLEGVYAINPLTPPGLPDADGALLATVKAKPAGGGAILWTRGDLVCGEQMSVPKALIDLMATGKVKDAPGEDMSL